MATFSPSATWASPTFDFRQERFNTAEAADYLGVSESFLRRNMFTRRHPIPAVHIGAKVFYLKRDLDAYVLSHRASFFTYEDLP